MTLAELSIRRPVFAWMLMAALILFGYVGFRGMGISQLPDVDFPVISIGLSYPGSAPEVMESSVVDPIEDAVMGIEGVRRVTSSSLQGSATVTVEFELSRDINVAQNDVLSKLDQARRTLPVDLDPPTVTKTNPDDQPIVWLALTSDKIPMNEMSKYVRDTLKGQFATVEGVGDIRLGGYLEPNLRVWVDPAKLDRLELTMSDVLNTIQLEHLEPPSGYLTYRDKDLSVRLLGEADSARKFEQVFINTRGGLPNFRPIPLTAVASVVEGTEDVRRLARSGGVPAVGLGILKQRGSNAVAVARGVRARLPEIQKTLPAGMTLSVRNDSTRFIENAVHELNFTLVLSALLTAAVCWLFLGSWSTTFNVLLSIPTSIVGSFLALYFLGFTLNTFTLLALSLAIGIVVDDSIMVLENIVRRRELGEGKVKAALLGTRQITFAAVAATFSVLAIFLPVAFMKGVIGKFFFQFGVAIAVAVLLSLLEALTLTPMRCARFLTVEKRTTWLGRGVERAFEGAKGLYARGLEHALRGRWLVLAGAAVLFGASLMAARALNKEFLPSEDQSQFIVRVKAPRGASLETTSAIFAQMEAWLKARPEIEGTFAVIGGGQVNTGFMFVSMKQPGQRGQDPEAKHELSQAELIAVARKKFNSIPGARAVLQDLSSRGFSSSRGFPIEFTVKGKDWGELVKQTGALTEELKKGGLVTDVDLDYEGETPEFDIVPDRARAKARGVSVESIATTVSAAISGIRVAKYTSDGRRYDIRVKEVEREGSSQVAPLDRLRDLTVRNNRGEAVPLLSVVQVADRQAPINLTRLNRQRAITVFANVAAGKSQQAALESAVETGRRVLPPGYVLEVSGAAQTFQESFQSLIVALALGVIVAYMILASQFNSFADPLSVLSALPLSLTGAFFALLATHQSLNLYSMIGLILLMGIVKKNSILLIDFTNQVRESEGASVRDGLLKGCPIRLRPILMTSIAQIVGAFPAALALGPGAESRRPMAVAVIGGVMLSTLLTLFVVPCVYTLLARKEFKRSEVDAILKEEARSSEPDTAALAPAPAPQKLTTAA
jgi:HAE1 family hydrophobic/amphiphilic exporter-1